MSPASRQKTFNVTATPTGLHFDLDAGLLEYRLDLPFSGDLRIMDRPSSPPPFPRVVYQLIRRHRAILSLLLNALSVLSLLLLSLSTPLKIPDMRL